MVSYNGDESININIYNERNEDIHLFYEHTREISE